MAEVADESQHIGTKNMGEQDDFLSFAVVVDGEDVDLGLFVSREIAANTAQVEARGIATPPDPGVRTFEGSSLVS